MTISSPTFQRLQTGITSADDLRVRGPINAMMAWLSGDLVTQLNTHFDAVSQSASVQIAAAISTYASTRPTFSAHKNGVGQTSITSATAVKVTFGTEEWDIGDYFASSTYTPPSGKYRLSACLTFAATNAVDNELLEARLFKNGTVYKRHSAPRAGTGTQAIAVSAVVDADGDDTFEIFAVKNGAGDGGLIGNAFDTYFQGEAIS